MKTKYVRWLKLLFIFSCLICLPALSVCQTGTETIINIGRQLAEDGLHEEAIVEYRRALFFSEGDSHRSLSYYLLGIEYRELEQWQKAEQALELALAITENESLKTETTLALASTYIISNKPSLAVLTLIPLLQETNTVSVYKQAVLISIIAEANQQHWNQAISLVDKLQKREEGYSDSSLIQLREVLEEARQTKPLDPEKAKFLSTMFPGAGQFYAGDVKNGLHALALNGINFWVVLNNLVQADYISAVLYAVFVTERYYAGNRFHAEQIAMNANESMEKHFTKNILSILARFAQESSR